MDCSITGFPVLHHLPELAQTHVHWVGDAIQPSHPVVPFSSYHQSVPISGSFQMSQLHIRWPKYWRFSFSISSPNEYSGLISFWIDWFDLLAVQETLKSFLQHYNSKAINSSALSCLYDPTFTSIHDYWKHHSFDYTDLFLAKWCLCFLISKKQASFNFVVAATVCSDFGVQENKICHCFLFFLICLPWSDGTRCCDLSFFICFFVL